MKPSKTLTLIKRIIREELDKAEEAEDNAVEKPIKSVASKERLKPKRRLLGINLDPEIQTFN